VVPNILYFCRDNLRNLLILEGLYLDRLCKFLLASLLISTNLV
jgi:hypothetical protein